MTGPGLLAAVTLQADLSQLQAAVRSSQHELQETKLQAQAEAESLRGEIHQLGLTVAELREELRLAGEAGEARAAQLAEEHAQALAKTMEEAEQVGVGSSPPRGLLYVCAYVGG